MQRLPSLFVAVLLLVTLTACESTRNDAGGSDVGGSRGAAPSPLEGPRESGGGLWEQLAEARARKEERLTDRKDFERRIEAGNSPFTGREREEMLKWIDVFLVDDPTWPELRYEWRRRGQGARRLLVEYMIMIMMRSWDMRQQHVYRRARGELVELAEDAEPYLVAALQQGHGDDVLRNQCIEAISLMGDRAVPALERAYFKADIKNRYHILRAMAALGSRQATEFFKNVIEGEDDFQMRITAIEGIGKARDPRGLPVLVRCLGDDDVSVRKFAAAYCGSYDSDSSIEPLIGCLGRAEKRFRPDNGEEDVASNCIRSLRRITGQRFKTSREWQSWWKRNPNRR